MVGYKMPPRGSGPTSRNRYKKLHFSASLQFIPPTAKEATLVKPSVARLKRPWRSSSPCCAPRWSSPPLRKSSGRKPSGGWYLPTFFAVSLSELTFFRNESYVSTDSRSRDHDFFLDNFVRKIFFRDYQANKKTSRQNFKWMFGFWHGIRLVVRALRFVRRGKDELQEDISSQRKIFIVMHLAKVIFVMRS